MLLQTENNEPRCAVNCFRIVFAKSSFRTYEARSRGYKTFFVLNSIEHKILNAHKYKNIKKFGLFLGSAKPRMLFFPLINVKMPTSVGILTFLSRKNFMLS